MTIVMMKKREPRGRKTRLPIKIQYLMTGATLYQFYMKLNTSPTKLID